MKIKIKGDILSPEEIDQAFRERQENIVKKEKEVLDEVDAAFAKYAKTPRGRMIFGEEDAESFADEAELDEAFGHDGFMR